MRDSQSALSEKFCKEIFTECTLRKILILIVHSIHFLIFVVRLGLNGGAIMDLFIILFGKEKHSQEIKSAITASIPLSQVRIFSLNQEYTLPFWLHLASTLHSINQKVIYPLGMFTLLLEFRGLSRIGKAISNVVGLAPSVRTVDKLKQELLKLQAFEIKDMIKNSISALLRWITTRTSMARRQSQLHVILSSFHKISP